MLREGLEVIRGNNATKSGPEGIFPSQPQTQGRPEPFL